MEKARSRWGIKLAALVCVALALALVYKWDRVFLAVCAGDIYSDVPLHIELALGHDDYGLASLIVRGLFSLGSGGLARTGLALLMTAANAFTLAGLWWLLRTLLPRLNGWLALLAAELALLCGTWIIPGCQTTLYMSAYNGNLYHNMTVLFSRAFIPGSLVFFFRCFDERHGSVKLWDALLFALFFLLCTAFKPNFAFAFIPLLAALLLYDLIKFKGRYLKNEFILGLCVVPAGLVCILQYAVLYREGFAGDSSAMVVRLVWGAELAALALMYLRGLLLPLYSFGLQARREESRGHIGLIALIEALAIVEAVIFAETGYRETHGNFLWGALAMYPVVFALGIALLFSMLAGSDLKRPGDALKCLLGAALLLGHLASGVYFLWFFSSGGSYFI